MCRRAQERSERRERRREEREIRKEERTCRKGRHEGHCSHDPDWHHDYEHEYDYGHWEKKGVEGEEKKKMQTETAHHCHRRR